MAVSLFRQRRQRDGFAAPCQRLGSERLGKGRGVGIGSGIVRPAGRGGGICPGSGQAQDVGPASNRRPGVPSASLPASITARRSRTTALPFASATVWTPRLTTRTPSFGISHSPATDGPGDLGDLDRDRDRAVALASRPGFVFPAPDLGQRHGVDGGDPRVLERQAS